MAGTRDQRPGLEQWPNDLHFHVVKYAARRFVDLATHFLRQLFGLASGRRPSAAAPSRCVKRRTQAFMSRTRMNSSGVPSKMNGRRAQTSHERFLDAPTSVAHVCTPICASPTIVPIDTVPPCDVGAVDDV